MGKSDPAPQKFRRKAKGPISSSSATERVSPSLFSTSSTVEDLLCNNNTPESSLVREQNNQTPQPSQSLSEVNRSCDEDIRESNLSSVQSNGVETFAESASNKDTDRPKDVGPSLSLPAKLVGLPHSESMSLCSNQSMDLSACHVQKEDCAVLVIFISNSSDYDLEEILLQINSEQLEVSYLGQRLIMMIMYCNLPLTVVDNFFCVLGVFVV